MVGHTCNDDLSSLSWLVTLKPSAFGALEDDTAGRQCRQEWKKPATAHRTTPLPTRPQYWSIGGDREEYTQSGEALDSSRPNFSFTCLIGIAILRSHEQKATVGKIYEFIQRNFPYFREAKSTWRNSVRHVLSLNKFFAKQHVGGVAATSSVRKCGSYWVLKASMHATLLKLVDEGQADLSPAQVKHLALHNLKDIRPKTHATSKRTANKVKSSSKAKAGLKSRAQKQKKSKSARLELCKAEWQGTDTDLLPAMVPLPPTTNPLDLMGYQHSSIVPDCGQGYTSGYSSSSAPREHAHMHGGFNDSVNGFSLDSLDALLNGQLCGLDGLDEFSDSSSDCDDMMDDVISLASSSGSEMSLCSSPHSSPFEYQFEHHQATTCRDTLQPMSPYMAGQDDGVVPQW